MCEQGHGEGFRGTFEEALVFAAKAHRHAPDGGNRKRTKVPYITHPVHVACILERHGYSEDIVVAGLLHDVLEDTPHEPDELRAAFGNAVLRLVRAVSEDKNDPVTKVKRPWIVRKRKQHEHLRRAKPAVVALKAADALHNVRTLIADMEKHGPVVFRRFNACARHTLWNYLNIARIVMQRLGRADPLAVELAKAVAELRDRVPKAQLRSRCRGCPPREERSHRRARARTARVRA